MAHSSVLVVIETEDEQLIYTFQFHNGEFFPPDKESFPDWEGDLRRNLKEAKGKRLRLIVWVGGESMLELEFNSDSPIDIEVKDTDLAPIINECLAKIT